MKNLSEKLLVFALFILTPLISNAQIKWQIINTSSTSSGLPSDEVISLRYDNNGCLWTSTNLSFAKYEKDNWFVYGQNEGLPSDDIRTGKIFVDSKDNKWICTDENGLIQINVNGDIKMYNTENGLMSNIVYDVVEDSDGGYYISNSEQFGNSLSYVDKDGTWEHYDFTLIGDNPFDYILCMYYDKNEDLLYLGTLFGGIKTFKDGAASSISEDYQVPISEITSDGKGVIYAATDIGLLSIDTNYNKTISLMTMAEGLPDNFITSVAIDDNCNVWAGTDGYGVAKIKDNNVEIFNTTNGLTSNDVYTITFDKDNNAWLGTHQGGICYQDGNGKWKHIGSTGLVGNNVNQIFFDDNVRWFATSSGISRNEGEIWKNFTFMNEDGTGLTSNYVSNIIKDNREGKNTLYAACKGGIAKYNSIFEEWEISKFEATDKDGNTIYPNYKLFQMSNGDMWITTFGVNLGIARFNPETNELNYYNDSNVDAISYNCNSFFEAVEAPDGSVWFGSVEGILMFKDGQFHMEKFETEIPYEDPETGDVSIGYDNNARRICFTEDGKVWIGKISGIIIYDPATGEKIQELGEGDDPVGLVTDFWFDGKGNTFISTLLSGIYMRTVNGNYYHLGEEYGLDPMLMVYSMQEKDGKLYICCDNGVMITADQNAIVNDILEKENTTDINVNKLNNGKVKGIYNTLGIRQNKLSSGINIVVSDDGSVKKVLVK